MKDEKKKYGLGKKQKRILRYLKKENKIVKTSDISNNTLNEHDFSENMFRWNNVSSSKGLKKKGLIRMYKNKDGHWRYKITQKGKKIDLGKKEIEIKKPYVRL
ncbi:hypothetical protein LCGC14_1350720 [marine sediment metagenome]|uniref:Uncharacterized protein n=1 Tax=marine sediment metagenome TaxID=412755 RepID=A0A0F9NDA9_9ZZZZ